MDETSKPGVKGKGKQPKKFVEQKDTALQLACIIGDQQEGKARAKVDKRHRHAQAPTRIETRSRPSSKEKLKEVKAAIKAENARVKRDKAKARKEETKQQSAPSVDKGNGFSHRNNPDASVKRKRVAFA